MYKQDIWANKQEERRLFLKYGENWRLIMKQKAARDRDGNQKVSFAHLLNRRFAVPVYPRNHFPDPIVTHYHITDKDKKAMAARLAQRESPQ